MKTSFRYYLDRDAPVETYVVIKGELRYVGRVARHGREWANSKQPRTYPTRGKAARGLVD